jgi:lysyl-tRNA synthetase class I
MDNKKTLKDKFYESIPLDDFSGKYSTFMKHAENCEKIAEQFAIKFLDSIIEYEKESGNQISNSDYTTRELLEIFKRNEKL